MANTTFSGPIRAGTISNTTGTILGQNVKNIGQVIMSQTFSLAFGQEGADVTTSVVIPANSQIISIDINVETAFNDTGADLLDIGIVGNSDLYVDDAVISAIGPVALGTTGLCSTWKDVGATDVNLAFIYNGANDDASAGAATVIVTYSQNANLS
tara:strand:- start:20 stop:484 length:465 start_codon:yes stop_codon:yes gene_type:complete